VVTVNLRCHPWSPIDAVRGIDVSLSRPAGDVLVLRFRVVGDLGRIRIPPQCPPCVAHQLWEHTCCEAFVAVDGASEYHEFNFAPSGEWAGYHFRSYREIAELVDEGLAPGISVRTAAGELVLDAQLPLARLSPAHPRAWLRVGLSAVIEAIDGRLSYWALHHPAGKPDFHHADTFALRLEPCGAQ
jgi:hypothetical protein